MVFSSSLPASYYSIIFSLSLIGGTGKEKIAVSVLGIPVLLSAPPVLWFAYQPQKLSFTATGVMAAVSVCNFAAKCPGKVIT